MSRRKILVLDRQGIVWASVAMDAAFASWRLHHAECVASAMQVLGEGGVLVGVMAFDSMPAPDPENLEPLLSHRAAEWIAVVPPQALADASFREFLVRSFHDYHTLPIDAGRLAVTLGHAYGKAQLRSGMKGAPPDPVRFGMVGRSPVMLDLYRKIDKVIRADAPVLISGESGTGKELVARAIHRFSSRANGPFVAVNCGAIPANLIQSELFGHEKGAFTGAYQRKIGSIEAAHGGVLFLDEIGDLPLDLQANLLHVLQERSIVRLGSTQRTPVDVRVLAATHVDLSRAISISAFREDLYYRLNVLGLDVPPLRDRVGDVALLAEAFFRQLVTRREVPLHGFSVQAYRAMNTYKWPGNVRELINCVQRAVIMGENRLISPADLGFGVCVPDEPWVTLQHARASAEKDVIESCLRANRNNVSQAARQLGISRVTLYRFISRFNIDIDGCNGHKQLRGGKDGTEAKAPIRI